MGLSRTVSEINGDFGRKSQIFPAPVYFVPRFPLELGIGAGDQKTRMMGLPGRQRSLTISSAVWIECTNVTDRQTDEQTNTGRQQRPRLRIASCGKNRLHFSSQYIEFNAECDGSSSEISAYTETSAASIYRKYRNINSISIYHIVSYRRRKYRNFRHIAIKFLTYHLAEFSFFSVLTSVIRDLLWRLGRSSYISWILLGKTEFKTCSSTNDYFQPLAIVSYGKAAPCTRCVAQNRPLWRLLAVSGATHC